MLVCAVLGLELPPRPAAAPPPVHRVELKQDDPFGSEHDQIQIGLRGGLLGAGVEAEAGVEGKEDRAVVALVLLDGVGPLLGAGDGIEKDMQRLVQLLEVSGADVLGGVPAVAEASRGEAIAGAGQQVVQVDAHCATGLAEQVGGLVVVVLEAVCRSEVAGLEQPRLAVDLVGVKGRHRGSVSRLDVDERPRSQGGSRVC